MDFSYQVFDAGVKVNFECSHKQNNILKVYTIHVTGYI